MPHSEVIGDELIQILKEVKKSQLLKKYADVMKTYQEFKELRKVLGKPVSTQVNPEKIKKDLSGVDFHLLTEEVKERKEKIGISKT